MEFFREGGWGMYPVVVFGFFLVAVCVLFAVRPEKRFVPLMFCALVLTAAAGSLGLSLGLVTTFHYIPQVARDEQLAIALQGCAESLNNAILALILIVIAATLATIGAVRSARGGNGLMT